MVKWLVRITELGAWIRSWIVQKYVKKPDSTKWETKPVDARLLKNCDAVFYR